jgi:uncharacterized protein
MLRSLTDKQKAATFYGITFALAVTVAVFGPGNPDLIQMLYMLTPTIGVLLLLLVLTPEGYHRSSWVELAMHRAGWRGWLPALVVPTAILAASYGAAFLVGVGSLDVDTDVVLNLLISIVINSAFAVLEEIGWRGYLLPHLAGVQRSAVQALVGLLHGVWHLPLMLLTTAYNPAGNRIITVPVFLAVLTGAGVIYGYLRSMSGSLWPVVIAHGTFNAVLGVISTAAVVTDPTAAAYLTGETGIFTLAGVLVAAGLLTRRHGRRPSDRFTSSKRPRRPMEDVVP